MKLIILCPQWGNEHLDPEDFLVRVKTAGYDGIDTWVPESKSERNRLRSLLDQYKLKMISHQHQAQGTNIEDFCNSFEHYLQLSAETEPVLINSHSGRDWFSLDENLRVLETAEKFNDRTGIRVAHETHRGRLGYAPGPAQELFARKDFQITADLSHWVCVSESYLENVPDVLDAAIRRTAHVHARVGFPEGPQVPDPRLPHWSEALRHFTEWWLRIFRYQKQKAAESFTVTTECGPAPYMWTDQNNQPLASQWEINLFMKDILRQIEHHL